MLFRIDCGSESKSQPAVTLSGSETQSCPVDVSGMSGKEDKVVALRTFKTRIADMACDAESENRKVTNKKHLKLKLYVDKRD